MRRRIALIWIIRISLFLVSLLFLWLLLMFCREWYPRLTEDLLSYPREIYATGTAEQLDEANQKLPLTQNTIRDILIWLPVLTIGFAFTLIVAISFCRKVNVIGINLFLVALPVAIQKLLLDLLLPYAASIRGWAFLSIFLLFFALTALLYTRLFPWLTKELINTSAGNCPKVKGQE